MNFGNYLVFTSSQSVYNGLPIIDRGTIVHLWEEIRSKIKILTAIKWPKTPMHFFFKIFPGLNIS